MTGANHESFSPHTTIVAAGRPPRRPGGPLNPPIELASNFHAGGDVEYYREGTALHKSLEEVIGLLEGGTALVYASGIAAANALLDRVPTGGTVVAPRVAYAGIAGRMRELHEAKRIDVTWVDVTDTAAVVAAIPGADLVWLESPTNPMLQVCELDRCLRTAREAGVPSVVDNTFATPLRQRPLELGADYVLHSATKSLAGHSDLLMGAVVCASAKEAADLAYRRNHLGNTPGALETYLALRGIRTLAVRVDRAESNAQALVPLLESHPSVLTVRYPGFGSMISIDLSDAATADAVCENVQLWTYATSLGGVESLLERRRRWAGESLDVPEGLIRLSVGIEDVDDLWADLSNAL